MSDNTKIEWSDATWNPVTGCDQVSPGCDHCYAMTLAPRLKAMGNPSYQTDGTRKTSGPGFGVALHPEMLDKPLHWKRPRRVFVNSMSDLFHADVPNEFIARVFGVMAVSRQHTFQVLTKRPRRMAHLLNDPIFRAQVEGGAQRAIADQEGIEGPSWIDDLFVGLPLPNVWLGVSVENQEWADKRIPLLLETPAAVRFLSCEPLLGPIDLNGLWDTGGYLPIGAECPDCGREFGHIDGCPAAMYGIPKPDIHWVIVGGESGKGARPMHPDWARSLRDQCVAAGVPFFFKQWGAWVPTLRTINEDDVSWIRADQHPPMKNVGKKKAGRLLNGRTWDEMPEREHVS